jgi:branched-chain amino acid transport system ATP-binding protein
MATKPAEQAADEPLLSVRDVTVRFGGIVALDGIAFDMPRGVVLGLIGPNGAGKTTLFNCLSRIYEPSSGDVRFEGATILDRPAHRMAEIGIGRTFQNLALFPNLSVRDNIKIGGHTRSRGGYITDALRLPASRASERELSARVANSSTISNSAMSPTDPSPACRSARRSASSWRARWRRNPSCCCSTSRPCGLNHEEVHELGNLIKQIRDERRITVLLVEHHMSLVMSIADRVVALNFGRKLAEGTPREMQANEDVVRAYLGDAA